MSEAEIIAQILLAHSHGDTRLFRFNAGTAWQGKVVRHTSELLVLQHPRAVKLAPEGFPDIAGWSSGGIFTGIEVKTPGVSTRAAQRGFQELMLRCGCRGGIARSLEDASIILNPS